MPTASAMLAIGAPSGFAARYSRMPRVRSSIPVMSFRLVSIRVKPGRLASNLFCTGIRFQVDISFRKRGLSRTIRSGPRSRNPNPMRDAARREWLQRRIHHEEARNDARRGSGGRGGIGGIDLIDLIDVRQQQRLGADDVSKRAVDG